MPDAGELFDAAMHAVALLDTAESLGVPREALAAASGLPAVIEDPMGATIPYGVLAAGLREVIARTGDEAIGLHMADHSDPPQLGVLGYLTVNQPTLRDILAFSYDLLPRLSNVFAVGLEVDGQPARFTLRPADEGAPLLHQMADYHCALFVRNTRAYVSPSFRPRGVRFAHAAPADTAEHRRIFRCPLSFGAGATVLEFDAEWLDFPVPHADPALSKALEPFARRELERLPQRDSLEERLRTVISGRLGAAAVTLGAVATQMGYRPRTLQFRLRKAGTSYQHVLDAVREQAARALLADSSQPMEVVAARLGFSDTAAFYRAFRRWTGTTPLAYRGAARQARPGASVASRT